MAAKSETDIGASAPIWLFIRDPAIANLNMLRSA